MIELPPVTSKSVAEMRASEEALNEKIRKDKEAGKRIVPKVREALMNDLFIVGLIYEQMQERNPILGRMVQALGESQEVRTFVVSEFFRQPKWGGLVEVPRGNSKYVVQWTDNHYDGGTVVIEKRSKDAEYASQIEEKIYVAEWSMPGLEYEKYDSKEEALERRETGIKAAASVDTFLKEFLNIEPSLATIS